MLSTSNLSRTLVVWRQTNKKVKHLPEETSTDLHRVPRARPSPVRRNAVSRVITGHFVLTSGLMTLFGCRVSVCESFFMGEWKEHTLAPGFWVALSINRATCGKSELKVLIIVLVKSHRFLWVFCTTWRWHLNNIHSRLVILLLFWAYTDHLLLETQHWLKMTYWRWQSL